MRRTLALMILSILLMAELFLVSAQAPEDQVFYEDYHERLDIYFVGDAGYWVENLTGGNITFPNLDFSSPPLSSVESLNISLYILNQWSPLYNFFRDRVGYNITLPMFIDHTAILTVDLDDTLSLKEASEMAEEIADMVSDQFSLAFTYEGEEKANIFTFFSPMEPEVHLEKVWRALPKRLGGFANVTKNLELENRDAAYISLKTSKGKDGYRSSLIVGALNPDLVKDERFSLREDLGEFYVTTSPVANSITVTLYAWSSYIKGAPGNAEVTYNEEKDLTRMRIPIGTNISMPEIIVTQTFVRPLLLGTRVLNTTTLRPGDSLFILFKVRNMGDVKAPQVTVTEERWWDPSEFELVSGDLTKTFPAVGPDETVSINYVLRYLGSNRSRPIIIPRAEITYLQEVGRVRFTSYSTSDILWIEEEAPALTVTLEDLSLLAPTIEDRITYIAVVENRGGSRAEHVKVGDIDIGSLEAGASEKILLKDRVREDQGIVKTLSLNVSWDYRGERYEVASPSFPLYFKPTTSLSPTLQATRRITLENRTEESITLRSEITLSNIGKKTFNQILVKGSLPQGSLNVSGNVEYDPISRTFSNSTLKLVGGETATLQVWVEVPPNSTLIFPPTDIEASSDTTILNLKTRMDSFIDSVKLVCDIEEIETSIGVNLTIPYHLINLAPIPAYDLQVRPPSPTGGSIENKTPLEIDKIGGGGSSDIRFSFIPRERGNITLEGLSATVIIAGKRQEITTPSIPGTIYRGLEVTVKAPASVKEDEAFELSIDISSDIPEEVKDIRISYSIPQELEILSKPEGIDEDVFQLQNGSLALRFQLISYEPYRKPISIPFPSITYRVFGEPLNYTKLFPGDAKDIQIQIQENFLLRYGVETLIVVLGVIATAFYIRRKVPKITG